ncbi:GNAT family N-acetyltransferase [Paenibacillus thalictri]|uniref:Acetyltransferase n=1 Tax=Paenibacillus thalictri TaxID=2527873 RepID=A0A4Q9DWH2_9BACL|nr:GNAT family N-acetyltransferase [Paenibacillus thalictri]TBL80695.1 acetyltransferase [Paenibacillus thalictri]
MNPAHESNRIQLIQAEEQDKAVIRNLMQYYQYDATEYNQEDPSPFGLFNYNYLDHYWTDHGKNNEGRVAYIVKVNGNLAGFALVNNFSYVLKGADVKTIAEFFIMRKYRKQGVGREVAFRIFDTHPGFWEVKQEKENAIAHQFWKSTVDRYTGGNYDKLESYPPVWDGPIVYFQAANNQNREGNDV